MILKLLCIWLAFIQYYHALYEVRTTTKSPNDSFLSTFPPVSADAYLYLHHQRQADDLTLKTKTLRYFETRVCQLIRLNFLST
jgi:hypothetical protein